MKPKNFPKKLFLGLVAVILGMAWASAVALQVPGPLVETGWLADNQGQVVVLDVRKDAASFLGTPPPGGGKPNLKKLRGHIPGAVSIPWGQVVAKGAEQGTPLKTMLPEPEAFAGAMRASGVSNDSAVVVAGRGTTAKDQAVAARLYFTLKFYGHDNVALLNGGTAQWAKEGRPLAYAKDAVPMGDFAVTEIRNRLIAGTREVEAAIGSANVQLVDCRTEDFYLGLNFKRRLVSPEHKGHLAGAKTLPFVLMADNSGPAKLFSAKQIQDVAAIKGVDLEAPTIAYCNMGVTASLGWFVLHEILGNETTRLYDGSMHAWSSLDPSPAVVSLEQPAEEAELPVTDSSREALAIGHSRSLQTLVDERRDALRRRRNDLFDLASGRRLYQTPEMAMRAAMIEGYWDSLRAAHRQRRNAMRLHRDAMCGAYAPWTRPYRDQAEIRHFLSQMEQLDRQERYDGLRFTHAYAPW